MIKSTSNDHVNAHKVFKCLASRVNNLSTMKRRTDLYNERKMSLVT